MNESWPRTFHLQILQKEQLHGDFADRILKAVRDACIEILAPPQRAGFARSGGVKWRGCFVQVRDVECMTGLTSRLQSASIICRPRRHTA